MQTAKTANQQNSVSRSNSSRFFSTKTSKNDLFPGTIKNQAFFPKDTIQPKLSIGQPNDKYEQEADDMTDQVVQKLSKPDALQHKCAACEQEEGGIAPKLQAKAIFESNEEAPIQRKCEACEQAEIKPSPIQMSGASMLNLQASSDLEASLNSSKGGGQPLSEDTQQSMNNAFGEDFSTVRVHTDSNAVQMNQELGAKAFTNGSDIYFNSNQYDPQSKGGQHLLAHELTHTLQQKGEKRIQRLPKVCRPKGGRINRRPFLRYLRRLEKRRIITTEERYEYGDNVSAIGRRKRCRLLTYLKRRARYRGKSRGNLIGNFKVVPKRIRISKGESTRISFNLNRRARSIAWGILEWEGSSEYGRGVGRGGYRFFNTKTLEPGFKYAYWNGTWAKSRNRPPETGTYRVFLSVTAKDGTEAQTFEHIRIENTENEVVHPRHASSYPLTKLVFDGKKVILYDSEGNSIQARAISGLKPNHSKNQRRRNYTLKKYQWSKDKGPIPEGTYTIHKSTVQHPQRRGGSLKYGTGGTARAWGIGRIPLRPYSRTSPSGNVVRTGFYLHLDVGNDGTAGCIGIHPGDVGKFNSILSLMGQMDKNLPVEVKLSR